MKKYRCTLDVDKEWIDNFNLVFNTEDENDAKTLAMIEVKQNLGSSFDVQSGLRVLLHFLARHSS